MRKRMKQALKRAITKKLNRQIAELDPVVERRSIAAYKAHATRAKQKLV